jgi:hypothetical protein
MSPVRWHCARIVRSLVLAVVLSPLVAADAESVPVVTPVAGGETTPTAETTPPVQLVPAHIVLEAKKGGVATLNPQAPTKMLGGVRVAYNGAFLLCDHLDLWQSKLTGLKRATLDHALIASGPDGEDPEHVIFDTRASTDPLISFRGIMRPREVEIIRQPLSEADLAEIARRQQAASAQPSDKAPADKAPSDQPAPVLKPIVVRFRVLLHALNDFSGHLHVKDGWALHVGYADEAEMQVSADLLPDGSNLANLRFSAIDLLGRPAAAGQNKKPARLERKGVPVKDPAAVKQVGSEASDWWIESSRITIVFDDLGRIQEVETSTDSNIGGTPSLDTPIQKKNAAPRSPPAPPVKP